MMSATLYPPKSDIINHMWNAIQGEAIEVDMESRRVGNQNGLSFMDQVLGDIARLSKDSETSKVEITRLNKESESSKEEAAKLKGETAKLKGEAAKLKEEIAKVEKESKEKIAKVEKELDEEKMRRYFARSTEIEKHGSKWTKQGVLARKKRNLLEHGGDIIEDLKILQIMETKDLVRYEGILDGYEQWYEISLGYRDQINAAPDLIIKTFNTLADIKSMDEWGKYPTAQVASMKICYRIIENWYNYIDTAGSEYPEDYIKKEYRKLVKAGGKRIR
jgi:hypothetical protein